MTARAKYADMLGGETDDPFGVANSYRQQAAAIPGLPDVSAPQPASPEPAAGAAPAYGATGWMGGTDGDRDGSYHPGWRGLAADVQGYGRHILTKFPGLRVSSGFRDVEHNARVGGVRNSRHIKGRAIDFTGSARDMVEAVAYAKRMGAAEALYHRTDKGGMHAHIAW